MFFEVRMLPAIAAAAFLLLGPAAAFADRKDGEKQRREKWDQQDRDRDYGYRRGGWGDGVARRDRIESDKEWRKEQKEREKDRREAAREWEKDQREAEREWDKERREAVRESRKNGRDRDYRYPRAARLPYPIR